MERDPQDWDTATLLLERYGQNAPEIARGWSRELAERHEPEAAARSLEIVDAAKKLLAQREPLPTKAEAKRHRRRKRPRRPDDAAQSRLCGRGSRATP
jgi:hypothetical protein